MIGLAALLFGVALGPTGFSASLASNPTVFTTALASSALWLAIGYFMHARLHHVISIERYRAHMVELIDPHSHTAGHADVVADEHADADPRVESSN